MNIIEPYVQVKRFDGIQIMKNLEIAAKQCYCTTDNISEDSYKHFLKNCLSRGHESVIEHEKVTIRLCCDVGVYKDITRHRHASFSIQSTRYCNYSKDKFGNEIKFIKPCNIDEGTQEYQYWLNCMQVVENTYMEMSKIGCKPDQLRMLLPHSTAAELCMTANIREWRHILSLRCEKYAHPAVQQVLIPLLLYFKEQMPELFEDIQYNEDFDTSKYAKLEVID
jgi:thymidylate synthase (FAD)